jgi:hypothetical protein
MRNLIEKAVKLEPLQQQGSNPLEALKWLSEL